MQWSNPPHELVRRVNITVNESSPQPAWDAITRDPFVDAGKYALGWVYFAIILLVLAVLVHVYHFFSDMIRIALFTRDGQEHVQLEHQLLRERLQAQFDRHLRRQIRAQIRAQTGAGPNSPPPLPPGSAAGLGPADPSGPSPISPASASSTGPSPGWSHADFSRLHHAPSVGSLVSAAGPLSPGPLSPLPPAEAVLDPETRRALEQQYLDVLHQHELQLANAYRPPPADLDSFVGSLGPLNALVGAFRALFYRPIPELRLPAAVRAMPITFPSIAIVALVVAAAAFLFAYALVPQPYFWESIEFGSPPLAVRAGMLSVSLVPWIVALSLKANFITLITGIGPERLTVMHRWLAYICLALAIIHMVPFFVTPIDSTEQSRVIFKDLLERYPSLYVYATGIAAFVPLALLCLHSLPVLRRRAYELFVNAHTPLAVIFIAFMFWHCNNYLSSWHYLISTVVIWGLSLVYRLAFLNWAKPWKMSWIVGDESAITILPENALKITVPTQIKWRPGQYVYIRMPGISLLDNHPFTIASLYSSDFPSDYGDGFYDMQLVFRPFAGFTKKVLDTALQNEPWQTYRAFIDGPYGGMSRRIEAFDTVILIAGGSGITSIVSQLLYLIKRMRDGKAATKKVMLVWSLRTVDTFEWFKEELRICRESAPPDSVSCRFFISRPMDGIPDIVSQQPEPADAPGEYAAAPPTDEIVQSHAPDRAANGRPLSKIIHETVNDMFQNMAQKRMSDILAPGCGSVGPSARNSRIEPAAEDLQREKEDTVMPLPSTWAERRRSVMMSGGLAPVGFTPATEMPPPRPRVAAGPKTLSLDIDAAIAAGTVAIESGVTMSASSANSTATFGLAGADHRLPSPVQHTPIQPPVRTADNITPTDFQKRFMRFAFLSPSTTGLPKDELGRKRSVQSLASPVSPAESGRKRRLAIAPFWRRNAGPDDLEVQLSSPHEGETANPNVLKEKGRRAADDATEKRAAEPASEGGNPTPPEWSVEIGRPDLPRLLRTSAPFWGRRTCVYVCGPPRMRLAVSKEVAVLQSMVTSGKVPAGNGLAREVRLGEKKAEVFLHTDNYMR